MENWIMSNYHCFTSCVQTRLSEFTFDLKLQLTPNGKTFQLCHRTLLCLKILLCFQNAAGFMRENTLLEETFGNMGQGLVPGQSWLPKCNGLTGDEIRTQLDFTLFMEYPGLYVLRHSCSMEMDIFFGWFQYILFLGFILSAQVLMITLEKVNMFPVQGRSCRLSGAGSTWYYENKFPCRFWFASELHHKTIYYRLQKIWIIKPT